MAESRWRYADMPPVADGWGGQWAQSGHRAWGVLTLQAARTLRAWPDDLCRGRGHLGDTDPVVAQTMPILMPPCVPRVHPVYWQRSWWRMGDDAGWWQGWVLRTPDPAVIWYVTVQWDLVPVPPAGQPGVPPDAVATLAARVARLALSHKAW